jgi:hypothetical protein
VLKETRPDKINWDRRSMELKSKGDIKERPVNEKEPFDL